MNIDILSEKMQIRKILCNNIIFQKLNIEDNGLLKPLSIFMLNYKHSNQFGLFTLNDEDELKISEVMVDKDFECITKSSNLKSSTSFYIGNSVNFIFIGTKKIEKSKFYIFYLTTTEFIFMVDENVLNKFISNVLTLLNRTILANDFKFLKNELEFHLLDNLLDNFIFLKIT
jgi:hypothetical protein